MRCAARVGIYVAMTLGWHGVLSAQVMLERGFGTSRAARDAAAMRGIGRSTSGMAGSLNKAAAAGANSANSGNAGAGASSTPSSPPAPVMYVTMYTPESSVPSLAYEDPKQIRVGMENEELLRRFGPPAMEMNVSNRRTVTYFGKEGIFQLDLVNDKVVLIAPTKPRPATISLPGL